MAAFEAATTRFPTGLWQEDPGPSKMKKTVSEIAELVGGVVVGDIAASITNVNGIQQATEGDLSFLGNRKYLPFLKTTRAAAILVPPDVVDADKTLIHVKNPYMAFLQVLQLFSASMERVHPVEGIHETVIMGRNVTLGTGVALGANVVLADDCVIGDNVIIYPNTYIGRASRIGDGTLIYPNVVVREHITIGARCILHANAVIGSDGFGFAPMNGVLFKVPQIGQVVLGDEVEVGSNSAIDRATFGVTVIGRGTKIDNLVQIGHNVEIGEHCAISGMSGIAGSTVVGNHVTIAAQVGVGDHAVVGERAILAARAGVFGEVKAGETVSGFPARSHGDTMRIWAAEGQLPEMVRRLRKLEQRIQELENKLDGQATDDSG